MVVWQTYTDHVHHTLHAFILKAIPLKSPKFCAFLGFLQINGVRRW